MILTAVMDRVLRATPLPLAVVPAAAARIEVRADGRSQPVAVMRHRPDAELFVAAPRDLRALAEALSETWHHHQPTGTHDVCAECGQRAPCGTRRLIAAALAAPGRRADSEPTANDQ